MNKAFVKESDGDDDDLDPARDSGGCEELHHACWPQAVEDELLNLIDVERPEVVRLVSWAASNGDRSENGDYIYGKRRLREIDRRIRFLTKRLDLAEVVDASRQENVDQVFSARRSITRHRTARITRSRSSGSTRSISIAAVSAGFRRSRALIKAKIGDTVMLMTPAGPQPIDVLDVRYPAPGNA